MSNPVGKIVQQTEFIITTETAPTQVVVAHQQQQATTTQQQQQQAIIARGGEVPTPNAADMTTVSPATLHHHDASSSTQQQIPLTSVVAAATAAETTTTTTNALEADEEAIVSAVNEAAEEVAAQAAASFEVNAAVERDETTIHNAVPPPSASVGDGGLITNTTVVKVDNPVSAIEDANKGSSMDHSQIHQHHMNGGAHSQTLVETIPPPAVNADGGTTTTIEAKVHPNAALVTVPTHQTMASNPSPGTQYTQTLNFEPVKREPKKRIRRVGKTVPRKQAKAEAGVPSNNADTSNAPTAVVNTGGSAIVNTDATHQDSIPRVLSKHDEKWNHMFDKLVQFKNEHNSTLVPQCYDQDPRLGRWVHYQRVEYWIFQQSGNGKITPDRIARLEKMGFEWDPQRAQWNTMFDKLKLFKDEVGHCKVPKGYTKDPELANWVRNQRLEHANMAKGKRSRMTQDRFLKLDELGFKWSSTMPPKGSNSAASTNTAKQATEATTTATNGTAASTSASTNIGEQSVQSNTIKVENGATTHAVVAPSNDTNTSETHAPIATQTTTAPDSAILTNPVQNSVQPDSTTTTTNTNVHLTTTNGIEIPIANSATVESKTEHSETAFVMEI